MFVCRLSNSELHSRSPLGGILSNPIYQTAKLELDENSVPENSYRRDSTHSRMLFESAINAAEQ